MGYCTTLYAVITLIVFSSISYAADQSTHAVASETHPSSKDREAYETQKKQAERDARKGQGYPQKLAKAAQNKARTLQHKKDKK